MLQALRPFSEASTDSGWSQGPSISTYKLTGLGVFSFPNFAISFLLHFLCLAFMPINSLSFIFNEF